MRCWTDSEYEDRFEERMTAEERDLNPVAAALGYPGLYWWQSVDDLSRHVDVGVEYDAESRNTFWTSFSILAGFVSEDYLKSEARKAREAEERIVADPSAAGRVAKVAPEPPTKTMKKSKPRKLGESDFVLHRSLGCGCFGEVMLATYRQTNTQVALKVLHKRLLWNSKLRERARNEFKINVALSSRMDHPFIVRLKYAFSTARCLCLAFEVAPCGELFQLITTHEPGSFAGRTQGRRFPEKAVRFYVAECLLALEVVHSAKVLYRDLKPENVLLAEDGHVKISDFGLSKPNVSDALSGAKSMCGTPEYMAPEILGGDHEHGLAVDFWALGALCFELLDGQPPWYAKDRLQLFDKILKTSLKMPKNVKPKLSQDCQNLLKTLLEKDKHSRLGVRGGASQVKKHSFFAMVDFESLLERKIDPPFQPKPPSPDKLDIAGQPVDWASLKPLKDQDKNMDITWEKFNQIFAGFDFRSPETQNVANDI